jgi:translation initiation factor 2 alpha subunit (eIF-2alpha)
MEEGDIVLCTVDRIIGTNVFVKIDGEEKEGSINLSEIAPGRIRNLRDYVFPKKRIVCKVLRTTGEATSLSLRRVTQKEKNELMETTNQEKSYEKILRTIIKENADKIIEEIKKKSSVYEFLKESKENSKELESLAGKENSKKILEIISQEKQKRAIIKREILLTTTQPNGLELVKEILGNIKDIEIKTISAGKYSLKKESEDLKKADNELKNTILEIENKARKNNMQFSVKEK